MDTVARRQRDRPDLSNRCVGRHGKRQTLRWDFIEAGQLVTSVHELQSHGATVYVALEGDEVAMFDQRFGAVLDQLQVDHVGSIRNVSLRRLIYLPPNK